MTGYTTDSGLVAQVEHSSRLHDPELRPGWYWWWRDAAQLVHGPFDSENAAAIAAVGVTGEEADIDF